MVMKWILTGVVFLLLAGCSKKVYDVRERDFYAEKTEQHTVIDVQGERRVEKDSAIRINAPVEQSSNQAADSSYVATSLAWSLAVWKNGQLRHVIGNFPQITVPSRIVYRDRWRDRRDTLILRDTVRTAEAVYVEKRVSPVWDGIWWGFVMSAAVAAGIVVYRKFFRR